MSPWRISTAALIVGLLLTPLCLFLTFALTEAMAHPGGGDPAGTAMAQGFLALALFLHCGLLAALVLTAVLGGAMPVAGRAAILLLAPAAFVAMFMALDLMTGPKLSPGPWALTIPGAAPVLIVAYCLWALIAPLRARVPARAAGFGLLGALGLICAAIIPLEAMRDRAKAELAAGAAAWEAKAAALEAKLAATPGDAHLSEWLPLLDSGVYGVEEKARAKILDLPSLQRDAEEMLARDALPWRDLTQFNLDPTPALCQNAQAALLRRAAALALKSGEKPDFERIADEFFAASSAIRWLVGFGCASDPQALAWEALGRSYGASDIQLSDLVEARDPKELGSTYDFPPKASMLGPRASLRAWLSFADGLSTNDLADRPRLLAGARALNHRNADALAWLRKEPADTDLFLLMRFLPQLDLDTTPQFCAAALGAIDAELAMVYRPTADNPLPYSELGERLGAGDPLAALQWLAAHGCDADAQLSKAQDVIAAYQPSIERDAMATALTKLKRKP